MRDGFDVNPRSGEGAGTWFIKILTGFLVIVILLIHLVIQSRSTPGQSGGAIDHLSQKYCRYMVEEW